MCDYSLHHVATRIAKVDDKLVTTRFANAITRGFSASDEPHVAVCLRSGTELAFDRNVETEPSIGFFPAKKIGHRMARFCQINLDHPTMHHDALEFPDGKIVLLTSLRPGQRATVLQLPAEPAAAPTRSALTAEAQAPALLD
jgi:hypothetical protein